MVAAHARCFVPLMLALVVASASPHVAPGQAAARPGEEAGDLQQLADAVLAPFRQQLNWDAIYTDASGILTSFYAEQGWDSEADLYSLDVILDVAAIPPWEIDRRLDRLSERAAERYDLSDAQVVDLRSTVSREAGSLIREHAVELLPTVIEMAQAWDAGVGFTPEQMARWTELTTPAFDDARQRFQLAALEFAAGLEPQQRAQFMRDLGAASKRLARVEELRTAARAGQWDPQDWGLPPSLLRRDDGDAAVAGSINPAARAAAERAGAEQPGAASQPVDDDPWAAYVRTFIGRYRLDAAQQRAAWKLYETVRARRDRFDRRFARRAAAARQQLGEDATARERLERADAAHDELRDRLFTLLKDKLKRLPTRAQRAQVDE